MARVGGSKATLYKFLTEKESLIGGVIQSLLDRSTSPARHRRSGHPGTV